MYDSVKASSYVVVVVVVVSIMKKKIEIAMRRR
jgi:hypothetical protein